MLLVLAAARRFSTLAQPIELAVWAPPVGVEVARRTLAIIGCGDIGRATARIARHGFGMRVIGCRRQGAAAAITTVDADFDALTWDFAAAVAEADFVSLHIPARPENVGFIDRERLARCRSDAWLINTARGSVVDEDALFDVLAARRLGGAALDVFTREPYVPVDPTRDLRVLPNVVLTPHIGSHTREANRAMAERALRNIRLAEEGRITDMDLLPVPT
jgi:phosphoglycerate dehydrogenase-like enzyme